MADYTDKTKAELVDEAKSRELSGYSTKNKEELATLLEEDDATKSDPGNLDNPEVVANLSPSGQEAEKELGETEHEVAAAELDAFGPLHLQSPDDRYMTGALSEEHGKEQRDRVQMPKEGHAGEFTESGEPVGVPPDFSDVGSRKDNLAEGDDRELYEVRPEDVIDFPPPLQEREDAEAQRNPMALRGDELITSGTGAGDVYSSKAVLYTDGLGGSADHSLDRAYDIPKVLQSTPDDTYKLAQGGDFNLRRDDTVKEQKSVDSENDQSSEEASSSDGSEDQTKE